ncbi:uncharacterized protein LOC135841948 [Planococcus citri]|uniref:uncharacterized protein LOC135841948 n=1 Tax=Planococcus citri TaxID=170843 RepID=UPI0031F84E34
MTTIMEITCENCQRPLIPPGPANQTQETTTYGVYMTKCTHFYHESCIKELYNTLTLANPEEPLIFICKRQNCAAPVKHDDIFLIFPTLRSRKIHSVGLKPDVKRALVVALDTINQLQKMAQESSDQLTIAQNKNVELEKKLKESNALYRKAIEDKACEVVHQRSSTQTDTNTKVLLATSEMPKSDTKQASIHSLDVTNDKSCEPQAQSCANAAAQASKSIAKEPTKTTTKQLPIIGVDQMPRTIVSQTPRSMANQFTNNYVPPLTTTYYTPFGNLRFEPKFEPTILANIDQTAVYQMPKPFTGLTPISMANQFTNNYVPPHLTTTYTPFGILRTPVFQPRFDPTAVYQMPNPLNYYVPSQTTPYTPFGIFDRRFDPIIRANIVPSYPAKEPPKRGPTSTSQTRDRHIQFQERFRMESDILQPFYPLDCYPFQYTAAGVRYKNVVPRIAILAKDVLMMGDGLIYGMVRIISKAIPFEFDLHPELYRRNLSIEDLVGTLDSFRKLPPRIMLSIGNWDAFNSMENQTFHNHLQKLLAIFRSREVKELYLIPPIRYTTPDSTTFAYIVRLFQTKSCMNAFGGKSVVMEPPFFPDYTVDEFGPKFEVEQFESYVRIMREIFIEEPFEASTMERWTQKFN